MLFDLGFWIDEDLVLVLDCIVELFVGGVNENVFLVVFGLFELRFDYMGLVMECMGRFIIG